jgi:DNA-binding MarR family transcriptional regulator
MVSTQKLRQRRERIAELSEDIGRELATKTMLFHSALADRLGLGATDLKCLDLLRAAQVPLTASNLVLLTGLTGGAITGVADRLEAAGFVERVRDPDDRRRWELRPKPDRQNEIAALFAPLSASMNKLCSAYDDGELDVIAGFLTGLGVILDEETERLRHSSNPESTQSD